MRNLEPALIVNHAVILASQGTLNFLKVKIAAGVKKAAGPIAVP